MSTTISTVLAVSRPETSWTVQCNCSLETQEIHSSCPEYNFSKCKDCTTSNGLDLPCAIENWSPSSEKKCLLPRLCMETKNAKNLESLDIGIIILLVIGCVIFISFIVCLSIFIQKKNNCIPVKYNDISID
eukprot:GFUD01048115.1.p1 GENE.GFUD01048115.1~~GFUD01048115.1.p1  ORF type:complete len:143 (-),score=6.25 GFUD01048115.1:40-432(-)